jgi:hypothetical protein
MREGQSEALGLFISCIAIIGFLLGFPGFSVLFRGPLSIILVGSAILGALLFIVFTLRRRRNVLVGIIALLLFGALAFGSTYGVMWYFMSYMPAHGGLGLETLFETPSNTRDSFVSHLKSGNFDQAYQLLSSDAQNQIPDAETLQRFVKESNWQPTKWKWTSEEVDEAHAHYIGEATYTDKRVGLIELWLDKIEQRWKISAMNFQPY